MNREHHRWHSAALGRDMELLVFGHGGAPMLAFPTSLGKFYEWEDMGMVGALAEHLEQGWVQLYCVDSLDAESWYARRAHPAARVARHAQYERYILDEVLPLVYAKNPTPFLILAGASFGAYHAMNIALRHPDRANRVIGMSGIYDVRPWADGYAGEEVYFQNPVDYIANESDPDRLALLRRLDIILPTGRDDPNRDNTERFSALLWSRGIWNALRIWDGWVHDWPWWRQMIRLYVGGPG